MIYVYFEGKINWWACFRQKTRVRMRFIDIITCFLEKMKTAINFSVQIEEINTSFYHVLSSSMIYVKDLTNQIPDYDSNFFEICLKMKNYQSPPQKTHFTSPVAKSFLKTGQNLANQGLISEATQFYAVSGIFGHLELAKLYCKFKQYDLLNQLLHPLFQYFPRNVDVWLMYSKYLIHNKKFNEALEKLLELTEITNRIEAQVYLSKVYMKLGEYAKSELRIRQCLVLDCFNPIVLKQASKIKFLTKDYEDAVMAALGHPKAYKMLAKIGLTKEGQTAILKILFSSYDIDLKELMQESEEDENEKENENGKDPKIQSKKEVKKQSIKAPIKAKQISKVATKPQQQETSPVLKRPQFNLLVPFSPQAIVKVANVIRKHGNIECASQILKCVTKIDICLEAYYQLLKIAFYQRNKYKYSMILQDMSEIPNINEYLPFIGFLDLTLLFTLNDPFLSETITTADNPIFLKIFMMTVIFSYSTNGPNPAHQFRSTFQDIASKADAAFEFKTLHHLWQLCNFSIPCSFSGPKTIAFVGDEYALLPASMRLTDPFSENSSSELITTINIFFPGLSLFSFYTKQTDMKRYFTDMFDKLISYDYVCFLFGTLDCSVEIPRLMQEMKYEKPSQIINTLTQHYAEFIENFKMSTKGQVLVHPALQVSRDTSQFTILFNKQLKANLKDKQMMLNIIPDPVAQMPITSMERATRQSFGNYQYRLKNEIQGKIYQIESQLRKTAELQPETEKEQKEQKKETIKIEKK